MASEPGVINHAQGEEGTGATASTSTQPKHVAEGAASQQDEVDTENEVNSLFDGPPNKTGEVPKLPEVEWPNITVERRQLNYKQLQESLRDNDQELALARTRIRDLENRNAALRTQLQNTELSNEEILRRIGLCTIDLTGWGTELNTLRDIVAHREARTARKLDMSPAAQEEREADLQDLVAQQQRRITELMTSQQANDGLVTRLNERIALEDVRRGQGDVEQIDSETRALLHDLELSSRTAEQIAASRPPGYTPPRTQTELLTRLVQEVRIGERPRAATLELLPRVIHHLNARIMQLWNFDPRRDVSPIERARQAFLAILSTIDPTYPPSSKKKAESPSAELADAIKHNDARLVIMKLQELRKGVDLDFANMQDDRELVADTIIYYFEDLLKRFELTPEDQKTLTELQETWDRLLKEGEYLDEHIIAWTQFVQSLAARDAASRESGTQGSSSGAQSGGQIGPQLPSAGQTQAQQPTGTQTGGYKSISGNINTVPGLGGPPRLLTASEAAEEELRRTTKERDIAIAHQKSLSVDLESSRNRVRGLLSKLEAQNGTFETLSEDIRRLTAERDAANKSVIDLTRDIERAKRNLAQETAALKGCQARVEVLQDPQINYEALRTAIASTVETLDHEQFPYRGNPLEGLQLIRELVTRRQEAIAADRRAREAQDGSRDQTNLNILGVLNELVNVLNSALGLPGQTPSESMETETSRITRLARQVYNHWGITPPFTHGASTLGLGSQPGTSTGQKQTTGTTADAGSSTGGASQGQGSGLGYGPSLEVDQGQLATAVAERDAAVAQRDELRTALNDEAVENRDLQERITSANDQLRRLEQVETDLTITRVGRVAAEYERDSARTELAEATGQLEETQQQLNTSQTQLAQVQQNLQARINLWTTAQAALTASTQNLADRNKRIQELNADVAGLEAQVEQLQAQVQQISNMPPVGGADDSGSEANVSGQGGSDGESDRDSDVGGGGDGGGGSDGDGDGDGEGDGDGDGDGDGAGDGDGDDNQGGGNIVIAGQPPAGPSTQPPIIVPGTTTGETPHGGDSTSGSQPPEGGPRRSSRSTRNQTPNYGTSSRPGKRKTPPGGGTSGPKTKKQATGKGGGKKGGKKDGTKGKSTKKGGKKPKKSKEDQTYKDSKDDAEDDDEDMDENEEEGDEEEDEIGGGSATGGSGSSKKGTKKTKKSKGSKDDETYKQGKDSEEEDDEDDDEE